MDDTSNYHVVFEQFGNNVKTCWQKLQTDNDFFDVTLAFEDGNIMAHKIVISCSSPVLRSILKQNSNPHSVIYFRGIKLKYFQSLVSFIYQGDVQIAKEDIKKFLELADDLKVEGLCKDSEIELKSRRTEEELARGTNEEISRRTEEELARKTKEKLARSVDEEIAKRTDKEFPKNVQKIEPLTKVESLAEIDWDTEKEMMDLDDCDETGFKTSPKKIQPNTSEKKMYLTDMLNSVHALGLPENEKLPIDRLQTLMKGLQELDELKEKFSCDECEKYYTQQGSLTRHKASAHKGVQYSCIKCDYKAMAQSSLKRHKEAIHEGITYPCDSCDYKGREKGKLRKHMRKIHNL